MAEHRNAANLPQIRGDGIYLRRFATFGGTRHFLHPAQPRSTHIRFVWQIYERYAIRFHGMNAISNSFVFPHASLLFLVVDDVNVRGKELLNGSIEVAQ